MTVPDLSIFHVLIQFMLIRPQGWKAILTIISQMRKLRHNGVSNVFNATVLISFLLLWQNT